VFVFAGDGNPVAGLDESHVRRLGPRSNLEVLALYPLADVVVVPSVIPEALNRVIIEAMAAGRPVVATRVGGNPELVRPEETGLLVERKMPGELADAIERLLNDSRLRISLGEGARRRVEDFLNPDASVRRLTALYQDVIAAAARR
jgi:glycosyltransferase involved in cell wall biosynthesis